MNIEISNLQFSYENRKIFNNFDFSINRGNILYCSNSGIGKSTLLKILLGSETPNNIDLKINNEISEIAHFKNYLSFASQEPFLINGTLSDNISLEYSGQNSQIDEFLKKYDVDLDNSFNHFKKILDEGSNLSAGQNKELNF